MCRESQKSMSSQAGKAGALGTGTPAAKEDSIKSYSNVLADLPVAQVTMHCT